VTCDTFFSFSAKHLQIVS